MAADPNQYDPNAPAPPSAAGIFLRRHGGKIARYGGAAYGAHRIASRFGVYGGPRKVGRRVRAFARYRGKRFHRASRLARLETKLTNRYSPQIAARRHSWFGESSPRFQRLRRFGMRVNARLDAARVGSPFKSHLGGFLPVRSLKGGDKVGVFKGAFRQLLRGLGRHA